MNNKNICLLKKGYCSERIVKHSLCNKSGHSCPFLGDEIESVIKRSFEAGVRWHNDPNAGWNNFKLREYQNSKLYNITKTTGKG